MSGGTRYFEDGPAPDFGPEMFDQIKSVCPFVVLVCLRNKNKNAVIYQARVQDGNLMDPPIEAYWLNLEPSYREARRNKGILHDREELGMLDHRFAWGFGCERQSDKEARFWFKNYPDQHMTVKVGPDGQVKLFAAFNGRKYLLRSLYVAASDNLHLMNLADNVKELYLNVIDLTEKPYRSARVYLKGGQK